jgi:glycosidase
MKLNIFCFMALTALTLGAAPRTPENAKWNVNFNPDGSDPSKYWGEWPGHKYFPSPSDWRDVGVYQFITDRFGDGDPRNNEGKYGGYDIYNVSMRHGGDFKGIKARLPYVKSLGFDAIWISPIFQNRHNSYHGYGQIDFTLLDERFGTLEEMRDMVNEAHRLGMYVIVDIVVNHLENLYYFEGHERDGAPFRFHAGEYKQIARDPRQTYTDFPVVNTFEKDYIDWDGNKRSNYPSVYGYDGYLKEDKWGEGSFWKSDLHHNGDIGDYGNHWENHLGKIYGGLDDLRTSHPRVQAKLMAMTKALISSTDIDGIRMDTPMQVPLEFFKRWAPAVKQHAKTLGKDDFFIFAEFYCPRERSATMVGRGKTPDQYGKDAHIDGTFTMNSGLNYDFYWKFIGPAVKDQENQTIQRGLELYRADRRSYDFYSPARGESRYVMLNFINNHDQWRMNWDPNDGFRKTRLGNAIIAFWPGLPLFYYGDEQGLSSRESGIGGHTREDFPTSKAWWDVESRSKQNPAVTDNFNMTHPDFLWVQKVMNVRRQYNSLRNTDEMHERWTQKNLQNGILAYTRVWGEPKNWALVVFNTWKFELDAGGDKGKFHTGWNQGDTIVNALNPSERITLGVEGTIPSISLHGYETKVFVRADNLQKLNPVVDNVQPKHDEHVGTGVREIYIHLSEKMQLDTLRDGVLYDGKVIPLDKIKREDDNQSLRFDVNITPGIHKIVVRSGAKAQSGKTVVADFQSRFRAGGNNNPIVLLQKEPLSDSGLVAGATRDGGKVSFTLNHPAAGGELLRWSVDDGKNWSAWQDYDDSTSHVTDLPAGKHAVLVQYWADGSTAYLSRGTLEVR